MTNEPRTLVDIFMSAEAFGTGTCFAFVPDGTTEPDQEVDYATFVDRSLRIATGLRSLGVGSGSYVAFVGAPRLEYMLLTTAVTLAGGVIVPVNHQFKQRELLDYLRHVRPQVIVMDAEAAQLITTLAADLEDPLLIDTVAAAQLEQNERAVPATPSPADTAVLLHTSGTTGLPKAVVRTHGIYTEFALLWAHVRLAPTDRIISFMPMYHQSGYLAHWLPAVVYGAPFYQLERFSPELFWETITTHRLTTGLFVPPIPSTLLARPDNEGADHVLEWGFGLAAPDVWKKFQHRFAIPLHGGYGSSETTMVGMTGFRDDPAYPDEMLNLPLGGSVMGKPIPGWCELRIADVDELVQPHLTVGEIQVRGPGVLKEYYNNPDATSAAFTNDGWFRTGDVGYSVEDGNFYLVDRTNNLIHRSGERVAPAELEKVLMDHPGVHEAAVLPVEDELRGEEIRACIVRSEGSTVTAEELFGYCADQLAPFKVPRYIDFVDSFPHTPTFKIQKEPLLKMTDRGAWIDRLDGSDSPG